MVAAPGCSQGSACRASEPRDNTTPTKDTSLFLGRESTESCRVPIKKGHSRSQYHSKKTVGESSGQHADRRREVTPKHLGCGHGRTRGVPTLRKPTNASQSHVRKQHKVLLPLAVPKQSAKSLLSQLSPSETRLRTRLVERNRML